MNSPNQRPFFPEKLGFTLVEILVAAFISLTILGVISKLIGSGAKMMGATTNSFHAVHLASKVFNDTMEEIRIHGSLLPAIEDFPELSTKDQVTDGISVYFRYIRDRESPWGIIDLAAEGGIRPVDGSLYQQLKPFYAEMKASALAAPSSLDWKKHIANGTITISWTEKDGFQRQYKIESNFFNPVGAPPTEGLDIDESTMPAKMLDSLFPGSTQSLDQEISAGGIDRDLALAVARVGVLTNICLVTLASIASRINELEKKSSLLQPNQNARLVKYQRSIAKYADMAASTVYQVLTECALMMKTVKERGTAERIRALPASPFMSSMSSYKTISEELPNWLGRAKAVYQWMLQDGLLLYLSQRERELALFKTLDSLRLQVALGLAPKEELVQFISNEQKKAQGRNPFLEKLFFREANLAENQSETRKRFPGLDIICTRLQVELPENLELIKKISLEQSNSSGGREGK